MVDSPRVLSIQSHVVHGYVGNKSATFPLQVLGFEVDPINSVQFSNHSGYKIFPGQILNEKDLDALAWGLENNDLENYTHLLTGYVRDDRFLTRISTLVKRLRAANPKLIYVCDPVMGDNGKMYVPENLLPIFRDVVLPLADIITPNQFEVELLTKKTIKNLDDAWQCTDILHDKGCKTVVISSTDMGTKDMLLALASSRIDGKKERITIKIPKLPASFTGTGDLFAALLLANMHRSGNQLKQSVERTVASIQAVLKRTIESAKGDRTAKALELKLIQSKKEIEEPEITISAEIVL